MNNFKTRVVILASCFLLMCFPGNPISAQSATPEKKWNFLADVYIMFPYMDGELGIGTSLTFPVEANPGDIFSKLQMAAMLYLEARTDKWAITSDLVYIKLDQEVTPGLVLHSGNVTAKQFIWEAAGLYRVVPFLEVGAGGRLNYLQTSVDARINVLPAGTEGVAGSESKTWCDPVVITRLTTDIREKWLF